MRLHLGRRRCKITEVEMAEFIVVREHDPPIYQKFGFHDDLSRLGRLLVIRNVVLTRYPILLPLPPFLPRLQRRLILLHNSGIAAAD